ncbi:MAG TPA: CoF synthetase [Lentisphaeria bacterium]|nr:CoF synthetase [Lentisphaeria bacterium]
MNRNASRFDTNQACSFLGVEAIRQLQTRLLRRHLKLCREHSPYYHNLLGDFDFSGFKIGDLARIPTTDKAILSEKNDLFTAVPEDEIRDISFSSGTTGAACRINYTENDLDRLAYNDAVGFASAGIGRGDRVLLTCTIDRCFIAGLAYYMGVRKLGATAIRNGINSLESHADIITQLKPSSIVGVPSFLRHLGIFLKENKIDSTCVRRLICIGEPLRDENMETSSLGKQLLQAWSAQIFSTYASSEIVTSFTECSAQCGGHLPPDLAILEIVDESGNPLPSGAIGEVTVTPLQVTGMPLIRFRTGDIGFMIDKPCRCGRSSPRIGPIIGRKAHMLKIKGTTIFPTAFFTVLDSSPEIAEYYLEASGDGLSDRVEIFVALKKQGIRLDHVAKRIQARSRLSVPMRELPMEDVRKKVFSTSRKPVRFFDLRKA